MKILANIQNHSKQLGTSLPVAMGYTAEIKSIVDDGKEGMQCFLISNEKTHFKGTQLIPACLSEGMLVQPLVGDTVLCIDSDRGLVVTQVLLRKEKTQTLTIYTNKTFECIAPEIKLKAFNELELSSAKKLSLFARDIISGASRTMLQQAKQILQNVADYSLTASGIVRTDAKQQLMTAEEDVRIDGKRINMG